jgi:hypothetical protein
MKDNVLLVLRLTTASLGARDIVSRSLLSIDCIVKVDQSAVEEEGGSGEKIANWRGWSDNDGKIQQVQVLGWSAWFETF